MKGSSEISDSAFEGLTVRSALALVESLQRSQLRTEHQIRKMFSKSSERFDVALAFIVRLGVVRKSGSVLTLRTELPPDSTSERQTWLLSRLLRVRNRYRSEVFSYLRKYRVKTGELVYRPLVERRSRESAVRNFLMEMGVVSYDGERGRYVVSGDYVYVYVRATETRREISPDFLTKSIAARDEIGLLAERKVMDFEKDRLGTVLEGQVDHVALRNVAAGYDIRSLTVRDGKKTVPRYIEVKAVSSNSMCFHWTQNEIGVAQVLKESYFLYLVPVGADGGFDIPNLKIIPDPHKVVLGSPSEWVIETDVIRCSLRKQCGAPHWPKGVLQHA